MKKNTLDIKKFKLNIEINSLPQKLIILYKLSFSDFRRPISNDILDKGSFFVSKLPAFAFFSASTNVLKCKILDAFETYVFK